MSTPTDRTILESGLSSMNLPAVAENPVGKDREMEDQRYGTAAALRTQYAPVLKDAIASISDTDDLNQDAREKLLDESARFGFDARLTANQIATIFGLIAKHLRKTPSDETRQEWRIAVNKRIREEVVDRYSQKIADERLQAARSFVSHRPAIATLLKRSGVGDHESVVMGLMLNHALLRVKPLARTK